VGQQIRPSPCRCQTQGTRALQIDEARGCSVVDNRWNGELMISKPLGYRANLTTVALRKGLNPCFAGQLAHTLIEETIQLPPCWTGRVLMK
jgi:hypothetical protein